MKISKLIVFLVSFALAANLCSCDTRTSGDKSSGINNSETVKPGETLNLEYYSFNLPPDLKGGETDTAGAITYTGKTIHDLYINERMCEITCKPYAESWFDEKTDQYSDMIFEKIDGTTVDCYVVRYYNDDENQYESHYFFSTQTHFLQYTAGYSKEDKESAVEILDEAARSVAYTSDYTLADEPQIYDCDYFTVNNGIKYRLHDRSGKDDSEKGIKASVRFFYHEAETNEKYLCPRVEFEVSSDGKTASDHADELYSRLENIDKDEYTDLEHTSGEIFGNKCDIISYTFTFQAFLPEHISVHFFDHNGVVYEVATSIHPNVESDITDIQEILNSTKIKDITEG